MQVESTRLYRVKAVAASLDVSAATIYRAVESGALRAVRVGTGKGAVRIPGQALADYMAACERAAATMPGAARPNAQAHTCGACGIDVDGLVLPAELVQAIVRATGHTTTPALGETSQDGGR